MFDSVTQILVVEDSVNVRKNIVDALGALGYRYVETAENATDGLKKLKAAQRSGKAFGLVLSDLNMPGPSGLDFLKTIRNEAEFKDLPFVLVTTESERGAVLAAVNAGVSGYVVKPFNVDTLFKKLDSAWQKHHPQSVA